MITHDTIIGIARCSRCRAERLLSELTARSDDDGAWPFELSVALPELFARYELTHLAWPRWARGRIVGFNVHCWSTNGPEVATMYQRLGLHVEVL